MIVFTLLVLGRPTVLVAAAWAAALLLRRTSASLRAGLWTALFVSLVALPAISPLVPVWKLRVFPALAPATPPANVVTSIAASSAPSSGAVSVLAASGKAPVASELQVPSSPVDARFTAGGPSEEMHGMKITAPAPPATTRASGTKMLARAAAVSWAFIAMGCALRLMLAHVRMRRAIGRSTPAPSSDRTRWAELVHSTSARVGLHQDVDVRMTDSVAVPALAGLIRPVLLLPVDASEWSDEACRVVVLHELAHAVRRDAIGQIAAQLACAMYWFMPPVWMAARRAAALREQATDDLVLTSGIAASSYAASLIELARRCAEGHASMASLAMASPEHLGRRVIAILDPLARRRRLSTTTALVLTLASIGTVGVLASAQPIRRDAQQVPVPAASTVDTGMQAVPPPPPAPPLPAPPAVAPPPPPAVPPPPAPQVVPAPPSAPSAPSAVPPPATVAPRALEPPPPPAAPPTPNAPPVPPPPLPARIAPPAPAPPAPAAARPVPFASPARPPVPPSVRAAGVPPLPPPAPPAPQAAPAPPPPPPVPPPPAPSVICGAAATDFSNHVNDDGRHRSWTMHVEAPRCRVDLNVDGKVDFTDDFTDVKRLSAGGSFKLNVLRDGARHELTIAERDGTLTRDWRVDGQERPFDAEAQRWFAAFLVDLDRQTAVGVDSRLPALLKRGGVPAVLAETALMPGDYARGVYYGRLATAARLAPSDIVSILNQATAAHTADYYAADLLQHVAVPAVHDHAVHAAALRLLATLRADYYIVQGAEAVVTADRPTDDDIAFVVGVAPRVKGDYYKATLVEHVAKAHLDSHARAELARVTSSMHEAYYIDAVIQALLRDGELDAPARRAVIDAASKIDADYYKIDALTTLLRDRALAESDLVDMVAAARNVSGDYYKAHLLVAIVGHPAVTSHVTDAVLAAADGMSDYYRETVRRSARR